MGICYDSACQLLDKIRTAMGQRDENYQLYGIIKMHDDYVGGCCQNGKRGNGAIKPKIVVALAKTKNGAALFARMKVVGNIQGQTLQQVIDQYFAEGHGLNVRAIEAS